MKTIERQIMHEHSPPPQNCQRYNLLLTKREGRTAEYWPEVVAVHTKMTKGRYSPVRLKPARLVYYSK